MTRLKLKLLSCICLRLIRADCTISRVSGDRWSEVSSNLNRPVKGIVVSKTNPLPLQFLQPLVLLLNPL